MLLTMNSVFKWRIYRVYDETDELVYVYVGKLPDIIALRNIVCAKSFNPYSKYNVIIEDEEYNEKSEALNALNTVVPSSLPKFNLEVRDYINDKFIICDQTGEKFRNQNEICQRYAIKKSNLSNHLRNRTIVKSLKGYSFHYYNALDEQRELMSDWTPLMYNLAPQYWNNFEKFKEYLGFKYRHPLDTLLINKPAFNYTPWAPIAPNGTAPVPPEALSFPQPGQTPLPLTHCSNNALYETGQLK